MSVLLSQMFRNVLRPRCIEGSPDVHDCDVHHGYVLTALPDVFAPVFRPHTSASAVAA